MLKLLMVTILLLFLNGCLAATSWHQPAYKGELDYTWDDWSYDHPYIRK